MPAPDDPPPPPTPNLWRYLRYWLLLAVLLVALAILAWQGRGWYHQAMAAHQASLASELAAEGNIPAAAMAARNAMLADPDQAEAALLMARMAQSSRSPTAVEWWARATELMPDDPAVGLARVRAALEFDQTAAAQAALKDLPPAARQGVAYHRLAGGVALRARDFAAARDHFRRASEIDGGTPMDALNIATLELMAATNDAERQAARNRLNELRANPGLNLLATRALLRDALDRGDEQAALAYAAELPQAPGSAFPDRLLQLEITSRFAPERVDGLVQELKQVAAASPQATYQFITWLGAQGRHREAVDWAATLPAERRQGASVGVALAPSLAAVGDWSRLAEDLEAKPWDSMEFLRLAWMARVARERGLPPGPLWARAMAAAGNNPASLRILAYQAREWQWEPEEIMAWEKLSLIPPYQAPALRALYGYYRARGDTVRLLDIFDRAARLNPGDATARNNRAALQLLLDRNSAQALAEARKLLAGDPANPGFATTFALGCLRMGQPAEGVTALETLGPQQLEQPDVAAYYGILLEAVGRKAEAVSYLERAAQADLLPQERQLVDDALARARM